MKRLYSSRGISLIELLIATALSLFLLAGLFTIYLNNKKTYQLNTALARLQENGRTAIQHLNHDVRMAGYSGCARLHDLEGDKKANSIISWRAGDTPPDIGLPKTLSLAPDSDALLIQELDANSADAHIITPQKITVNGQTDFRPGDTIVLSNCENVAPTQIKSISNNKNIQTVTIEPALSDSEKFSAFAEVSRALKILYYVAPTERKNSAGDRIFALYRRDLNAAPSAPNELVEGVENMRVYFHTKDDPTREQRGAEILNGSKVTSVRIALLLDSVDPINSQPKPYVFLGKTFMAGDKRLRREWDATIALREYLP
jgi:type IV pilus assembly protein PilW